MKNKQKKKGKLRSRTVIGIFGSIIVIGLIAYAGINSMIPVNADHPVFLAPTNIYIKAVHSPGDGYAFLSQSVKGGKVPPLSGASSTTYHVNKGNLVSIHLINEDKSTSEILSRHNINIDEFNVHSKTLHYFDTQTITFLADKQGEFDYYSTTHPEMRGKIVVG